MLSYCYIFEKYYAIIIDMENATQVS